MPSQTANALPPIQHDSLTWRLPLSWAARDLLAACLLAADFPPNISADLRQRWVELLRIDPPLLIDAVLTHLATRAAESKSSDSAAVLPLGELADGLLISLAGRLLAAPSLAHQRPIDYDACDKLRKKFLRLPLARWLPAAGPWLELVGPPPPRDWVAQWSAVSLVDDQPPSPTDAARQPWSYHPGLFDLAQLARQTHRAADLQQRFASCLDTAKRAAVKQFAYGLSHEINNPLANISTRAQTLMRQERDPDCQQSFVNCQQSASQRNESLQRIVDQAMRAHEMTADLMFYARPPQPRKTEFDLWSVVQSVVRQAEPLVRDRSIELVVPAEPAAVNVLADRAMLIEAVRSLVRNAIEAIGIDGRITIDCDRDDTDSAGHPMVLVTVSDSGPGLTLESAVHAFDPYYSGREAGRGLGVGLCRVEGIAKIHGGRVQLASGPAGCVARVWIPLA